MNMEKFTNRSKEALVAAQNLAIENHNTELTPLHVLSSLINQTDGLVGSILTRMNCNKSLLNADVARAIDTLPKVSGGNQELYQSRGFSELLLQSNQEAEEMHDEYISVEHIFLALTEKGGEAQKILAKYKIDKEFELEKFRWVTPVGKDSKEQ